MSNLSIYEQNTIHALGDCEEAQDIYLRFKDKPNDIGFIAACKWAEYSDTFLTLVKMAEGVCVGKPEHIKLSPEQCTKEVYEFIKTRFINMYFPNSRGEG